MGICFKRKMDRIELQNLRDLPIEGVAERLGLRVERHKCLCPFHDDHHASMTFKVSRNTYRCYACGASGGTIDLVMKCLNKDFLEACKWLADGAACVISLNRYNVITTKIRPPFDANRYARFFEHPFLNVEAKKFLFEERRLDPRVVRWCRLTSWRDRQGIPWLQIPYYNREGKLVGLQNRNLGPSKSTDPSRPPLKREERKSPFKGDLQGKDSSPWGGWEGSIPRFRFPQGSECGIYNLPVLNLLKPGETLYITEGCSDCWAMLSAGHKAIAIPSATLLGKKDRELLLTLSSSPDGVDTQAELSVPACGLGRGLLSIINGYNEERRVKNITFEGLKINGRAIYDDMPGKPKWYQTADYVPMFVGNHVEGLTFKK